MSPREGERYYLRTLLCHVPGPSCQDDLLKVEVNLHPFALYGISACPCQVAGSTQEESHSGASAAASAPFWLT